MIYFGQVFNHLYTSWYSLLDKIKKLSKKSESPSEMIRRCNVTILVINLFLEQLLPK